MYLDLLEEAHRIGLRGLTDGFVDAQVRFVTACQQPDGGFRGRQGGSDLYYTDFALRSLTLLAPGNPAVDRAAGYLSRHAGCPQNVVEAFSILNLHRMMGTDRTSLDPQGVLQVLRAYLLAGGGLARWAGDSRASAYHTFLGALCFQMLGEAMPAIDGAVRAVETLGRADGGFTELDGQSASQTSATAAAVAFLVMHDALSAECSDWAVRFLTSMHRRRRRPASPRRRGSRRPAFHVHRPDDAGGARRVACHQHARSRPLFARHGSTQRRISGVRGR